MAERRSIISDRLTRNLTDKLLEKRQAAARELEDHVRQMVTARDRAQLEYILRTLGVFCHSASANTRKGGLIGLASASIALGENATEAIDSLVPAVVRLLTDSDPRVRYFACESLWNIIKVVRGAVLDYFNDIFDALCRLFADGDIETRNAAHLLDRLVKDVVTESSSFDLTSFTPVLRDRVFVINPNVRVFILSWLTVLQSVPDLHLIALLPDFLDGLFHMLGDDRDDICKATERLLGEFARDLSATPPSADYLLRILPVLLRHCQSNVNLAALRANKWVNTFVETRGRDLASGIPIIVGAILPCLSHPLIDVQSVASNTNAALLGLMSGETDFDAVAVDLDRLREPIMRFIIDTDEWSVPTRLAALQWTVALYEQHSHQADADALMSALSDPDDKVLLLDLEVLARLFEPEPAFSSFIPKLVAKFAAERRLLANRGTVILRRLSFLMGGEKVYLALAQAITSTESDDPVFAAVLVYKLDMILLTSPELFDLRAQLRDLSKPRGLQLFKALYPCWSQNPVATISLCLLSQTYQHAAALVSQMAEFEITVDFMVDLDRLVQLLESPIFMHVRLHLLHPRRYPDLFRTLCGLLMLLPQTTAFTLLHNRLTALATLHMLDAARADEQRSSSSSSTSKLKLPSSPSSRRASNAAKDAADAGAAALDLDFDAMLKQFVDNTHKHRVSASHQSGQAGVVPGTPLLANVVMGDATPPPRPRSRLAVSRSPRSASSSFKGD